MLKKSIGVGLLFLTGQAYANILITTTDDVVKDDKECSIREAVVYVNQYLTVQNGETEEQKKEREKIKKSGYFGCGGETATANIILKEKETYTLNEEVKVSASVSFLTENNNLSTSTKALGLSNATIKPNGKHRLFLIDDGRADISQINVKFQQINLEGCGTENICANQGGIVFNREALTFEYVTLSKGSANEGGAVYSEGLIAGTNRNSASHVSITSSIVKDNQASNGAVLFMGQPLFNIKNSVIRDNKVLDSAGAVIYSANSFDDETTGTISFNRVSYLTNSTLFNNTGYLLNVRDGVSVNNATVVDNTKGFYFDAPNEKAHVSNSIIVNKQQDCSYSANDESLLLNNLVGGSTCKAGTSGNPNIYLPTVKYNKLFAGSKNEGLCDRPPAEGLLCPYYTPEDSFLGVFKPRLLSKYLSLNDSPIVNRGRMYSDGTTESIYSCEGTDQRGLSRGESVHCDLGAVELVISSETVNRIGAEILYGEIAKMTIMDSLADGELLPAEECKNVFRQDRAPNGEAWKNGCLRIEQSTVTPQSKGTTVLYDDGEIIYTPASNYHGLDEFELRVITTASRFSESEKDRDVVIPTRIVQSPVNNFVSDKVKVSGGSMGLLSLFGLFALAFRRNTKA